MRCSTTCDTKRGLYTHKTIKLAHVQSCTCLPYTHTPYYNTKPHCPYYFLTISTMLTLILRARMCQERQRGCPIIASVTAIHRLDGDAVGGQLELVVQIRARGVVTPVRENNGQKRRKNCYRTTNVVCVDCNPAVDKYMWELTS